MRRSWTASGSVLLLFLLGASGAGADWTKDYQAGRGKCKAGQYAAAIPLLQRAMQDKPRSCLGCIRTGMFFEDYFPLYYLGQALMETGRTADAAECYEQLESEGLIRKSKDLGGPFQMALQSARSLKKPPPPAAPEPAPAGPVSPPSPVPVEPPPPAGSAPPPPKTAPPSTDPEAVLGVRRKLDGTERQLEQIDPAELRGRPRMLKHYQGMKETVREIRDRLAATADPRQVAELDERAGRLLVQAPRLARAAGLSRELREAFEAVRDADLKANPDLAREHAGLRDRMRAAAERSFDGRGGQETEDRIAELEAILRDLRDANGRLAQRIKSPAGPSAPPAATVSAPPPVRPPTGETPSSRPSPVPLIRKGFEHFFKGDLDAAAKAAGDLAAAGESHPYAWLLRGVVAWTRYAAEGGVDDALGKEAGDALASARRAGLRSADLPAALFSPKLIAFFEQVR